MSGQLKSCGYFTGKKIPAGCRARFITAVHLYTLGERIFVSVERNGQWEIVIEECCAAKDIAISHIKELGGAFTDDDDAKYQDTLFEDRS